MTYCDNVVYMQRHNTPCGNMVLASFNNMLCLCDWETNSHHDHNIKRLIRSLKCSLSDSGSSVIDNAIIQLDEYFSEKRFDFNLPLLLIGTNFQKFVWHELTNIAYGKTSTYKNIAAAIGNKHASRATANAIGSNPISIIIPCHRIIGCNNSLTGYAGGISTKQFLLSLEQHNTTTHFQISL